MNDLQKKYFEYMKLIGCVVEYELADGTFIQFSYEEKNFAHLLGLHKLTDVQLVQFWLDRNNRAVKLDDVLRRIRNGSFTDAMVKASVFYSKIQERYESFSYDNLTTLNYIDVIIDFDSTKMPSKIRSDYLLFEKKL